MFYLLHLFRSFLPMHNPIGFGAADFIALAAGLAVLLFALSERLPKDFLRGMAERTGWCMLALFLLPIALRLLLLSIHPIPSPEVSDDFSYLLLGDTLAHFRLANPPHPLHQFFETYYVLQQPAYGSVYPLGQGIVLAFGELIFRNPWAGVAISVGAMCALCYWMLRAWVAPSWALLGGLLCAIELGPLNHWINSYWGGAVSACAGCLTFGALPRLRADPASRWAALLGLGIGIEMLSRPYESVFLITAVLVFLLPGWRRTIRTAPAALAVVLAASGLISLDNKSATGSWTTLPYMLSRYQYGIPAAFTPQPDPAPHVELTRQQQLAYQIQSSVHDSAGKYFPRLFGRARFYRFFFLAPLYLAIPFFLLAVRELRFAWVLGTVILFALGSNFYPYFYPHYIAAIACLLILIGAVSLERLSSINSYAARIIVVFCFAHFLFWYGLHASGDPSMWRYETSDAINYGDPAGRIAIQRELLKIPEKELVFVRYRPQHTITEWVFNSADIDHSKIVWARDLGAAENEKLRQYYPDRKIWLLEADVHPPALEPYQEPGNQPAAIEAGHTPATPPKFEEVK